MHTKHQQQQTPMIAFWQRVALILLPTTNDSQNIKLYGHKIPPIMIFIIESNTF
jgi:hypothetical protein